MRCSVYPGATTHIGTWGSDVGRMNIGLLYSRFMITYTRDAIEYFVFRCPPKDYKPKPWTRMIMPYRSFLVAYSGSSFHDADAIA